jgi:tetratricopeptide (TPR) repeat protein
MEEFRLANKCVQSIDFSYTSDEDFKGYVKSILSLANNLIRKGDFHYANDLLVFLTQIQPYNINAYMRLGDINMTMGKIIQAYGFWRKAEDLLGTRGTSSNSLDNKIRRVSFVGLYDVNKKDVQKSLSKALEMFKEDKHKKNRNISIFIAQLYFLLSKKEGVELDARINYLKLSIGFKETDVALNEIIEASKANNDWGLVIYYQRRLVRNSKQYSNHGRYIINLVGSYITYSKNLLNIKHFTHATKLLLLAKDKLMELNNKNTIEYKKLKYDVDFLLKKQTHKSNDDTRVKK